MQRAHELHPMSSPTRFMLGAGPFALPLRLAEAIVAARRAEANADELACRHAILVIALVKLATSAIFVELGLPAWMGEELPPLFQRLVDGRQITEIGIRQYGVVTFLIFDPVVWIFGDDPAILSLWSLVLGLASITGALALTVRRFFPVAPRRGVLLAAFWFGFTPTAYVVAQRHIEAFELLFLSAAIYLYTSGSSRLRVLATIPLAAGMLTKLLPGAILAFLTLRDPRRSWPGWCTAAVLLVNRTSALRPTDGSELSRDDPIDEWRGDGQLVHPAREQLLAGSDVQGGCRVQARG